MWFCKLQYLLSWKALKQNNSHSRCFLKVMRSNIIRACTFEYEMQLQLCTKDGATQQAKPTCTANLGHTSSGVEHATHLFGASRLDALRMLSTGFSKYVLGYNPCFFFFLHDSSYFQRSQKITPCLPQSIGIAIQDISSITAASAVIDTAVKTTVSNPPALRVLFPQNKLVARECCRLVPVMVTLMHLSQGLVAWSASCCSC